MSPLISRRGQVQPFRVMQMLDLVHRRARDGKHTIMLCAGQPTTGAPEPVLGAVEDSLHASALGYTEVIGDRDLRETIAAWHSGTYGVTTSADNVIITTGSSGGFVASFLAVLDHGDNVALSCPGYPAYRNILESLGARVVNLVCDESTRFQPTAAMLEALPAEDRPRAVIVTSPGNPSGTIIDPEELERIARWCEDNDAVLHSGRLDGYGIPPDFFSDRHARNCFAFAFDPHELNEVALDGLGTMLTMPLPPSFLGYDPEAPHHTLDLARAEEHCRQAWDGRLWEHGMYVTLPYLEGIDISEQPARMLKRHLEALNPRFTVDLRPASDSEYWPLAGAGKLPVDLAGWLAGFPDPHDFIHPFYASDGWFASQYGYSNPELDALVEEARTHPDPARRAELYARIARIGFEDAPFVVMPEPPVSLVIGSKVEGTYFNPMLNGWFLWKDIRKAE